MKLDVETNDNNFIESYFAVIQIYYLWRFEYFTYTYYYLLYFTMIHRHFPNIFPNRWV